MFNNKQITIADTTKEIFIKTLETGGYSDTNVKRYCYTSRLGGQIIDLGVFNLNILQEFINTSDFKEGEFVGTWVSGDKVFLDIATSTDDFDKAYDRCYELKELALWDNELFEEIEIDYTVKNKY